MKRGLIHRYAVVSLDDPAGVTRSIRRLRERTGDSAGVYVIIELPRWCRRRHLLRMLIAGASPVIYIGGSNNLRTRVPTIARGLAGCGSRHKLVAKVLGFDPPIAPRRLFAILISFFWYDSLEDFLLHEHFRRFDRLPIGNQRVRARSNASNRPNWVHLSWHRCFSLMWS